MSPVVGVLLAAMTAGAGPWDRRTHFTFSGPVAVPGLTLPAGEYIFRLVDTIDRSVIQVLSADGQQSYAMFFGHRVFRTDVLTVPELRFMETAAGMPPAIESWWYPGVRDGYEFLYLGE